MDKTRLEPWRAAPTADATRENMDAAALDYLDAILALEGEYKRDGRRITARYSTISGECAARMEAAETERWHGTRALNDDYRKRAAEIAAECMDRAEHPEDIAAALGTLDATIGGTCRDSIEFNADTARAALHDAVRKRTEREARGSGKARNWLNRL